MISSTLLSQIFEWVTEEKNLGEVLLKIQARRFNLEIIPELDEERKSTIFDSKKTLTPEVPIESDEPVPARAEADNFSPTRLQPRRNNPQKAFETLYKRYKGKPEEVRYSLGVVRPATELLPIKTSTDAGRTGWFPQPPKPPAPRPNVQESLFEKRKFSKEKRTLPDAFKMQRSSLQTSPNDSRADQSPKPAISKREIEAHEQYVADLLNKPAPIESPEPEAARGEDSNTGSPLGEQLFRIERPKSDITGRGKLAVMQLLSHFAGTSLNCRLPKKKPAKPESVPDKPPNPEAQNP